MKKTVKVLFIIVLIVSLGCNVYCFYESRKLTSSIVKLGFGEHNIKVYCEKADDVKTVKIDFDKGSYKIGSAEIINKENLYLVSPEKRINLSELGGDAFVINSNG